MKLKSGVVYHNICYVVDIHELVGLCLVAEILYFTLPTCSSAVTNNTEIIILLYYCLDYGTHSML